MKTIRARIVEMLLDRILRIKIGGKEIGRNIIMSHREHIAFAKACRTYGNGLKLKKLFSDLAFEKVVIYMEQILP